jgi:sulfoxide reductase heme-binding subunit YedZ
MTNADWYAARGTGAIALVLLTVVMVLGVGSRSGRPMLGLPRFALSLVHRNAALLASVLIVVHVATLLADPYTHLRLADLVLPFGASYRPFWAGLGTIAVDLMIALIVTSLLRARIPERTWRFVHWFAYALWPIAWLHGIGTGTDRGSTWYRAVAVICAVAVTATVAWRATAHFRTIGGRRVERRLNTGLADPRPAPVTYPRSHR